MAKVERNFVPIAARFVSSWDSEKDDEIGYKLYELDGDWYVEINYSDPCPCCCSDTLDETFDSEEEAIKYIEANI